MTKGVLLSRRSSQQGGNIILALIFSFLALATAVGVVTRTQGSYQGSAFGADSRDAREVAEYGIRAIISEMALSRNRRYLVAHNTGSAWVNPDGWVTSGMKINPCASALVNALPSTIAGVTGSSKVSVGGESSKQYWLRSVTYRNDLLTTSATSGVRRGVKFERSSPGAWGASPNPTSPAYSVDNLSLASPSRAYITLEVQGESTAGGKTSIARVSKEFELFPKCCGRSFGHTFANLSAPVASFGNDTRACAPVGLGRMSLVTGISGGTISTAGNALNIQQLASDGTARLQEQVLTRNLADANRTLTTGNKVVYATQSVPAQLGPSSISNSGCLADSVVLPRDGLSSGHASGCASGSSRPAYCAAAGSDYTCRIRHIRLSGNQTVTISRVPIAGVTPNTVTLMLDDTTSTGSGGSAIAGGSISLVGNSGFQHLNASGNPAAMADAWRFRVINRTSSAVQLNGGATALAGFFDFRASSVSLKGSGDLVGILWANNLSSTGNVRLLNPPNGDCALGTSSSTGTVCGMLAAIYPAQFDTNPSNDPVRPEYDYTPRNIFSLRLL